MRSAQKGVIFDMDGVIINNNDWHVKSWMEYARRRGIALTEAEFPTRVFGKTNEEILALEYPDASPEQLFAWSLEKEALYRDMYRPHFRLADGLLAFLDFLKKNQIPIAVASNAPLVNIDFALDEGQIRHYFDAVVYPAIIAKPKPAPDAYLKAAELLGLEPAQCFVIEDSPTGLQAAVAAGCRAIGITSTFPETELRKYTQKIVSDFSEIQLIVVNEVETV